MFGWMLQQQFVAKFETLLDMSQADISTLAEYKFKPKGSGRKIDFWPP